MLDFSAALLMLRTYALYNRNKKVIYLLSTISALGAAISAVSTWHDVTSRFRFRIAAAVCGEWTDCLTWLLQWAILSVRGSNLPSADVSLWVGCDLRISQKQCVGH